MMNEFLNWLAQNGLTEAFTTGAGDSLYVNHEKQFGVIHKAGELGAHSFYFDDIVECQTYDDGHLIVSWGIDSPWKLYDRKLRYSTSEVYMKIRFRDHKVLKLQIFRSVYGNVIRNTNTHVDLLNYSCQLTQILYSCVAGCPL